MRCYFDLKDGAEFVRDDQGLEVATLDMARVEAIVALTDMARDWLPSDGPKRDLSLLIRHGDLALIEISFRFEVRALSENVATGDKVLPRRRPALEEND